MFWKSGDTPEPIQNGKGYCVAGYDDMIPESDFCYRISPPKRNTYQEETELWSEAEMDCRYLQAAAWCSLREIIFHNGP